LEDNIEEQASPVSLVDHFSKIDDPRVEYLVDHQLIDIITIAVCAVIAGADNWVEVEQFGHEKQAWFGQFLELAHGIPSHDTFDRVFGLIKPEQFQQCFLDWGFYGVFNKKRFSTKYYAGVRGQQG
jgi:hypothetical protein